jgi:hypothetical protein
VNDHSALPNTQIDSSQKNFNGLAQQCSLFERMMLVPGTPVLLVIRVLFRRNIALAFQIFMALVSVPSYGQAPAQTMNTTSSSLTMAFESPQAQSVSTLGEHRSPSPDAGNTGARPVAYVFPSAQARAKDFLGDLFSPTTLFAPAISAGIDQARPLKVGYPPDGYIGPGEHPAHGSVPEWGEGFSGYSKRYASRLGMNVIGLTGRYAIGEALHEDTTYHPCGCTGILPRTYHAITQTLIAHTSSGRSVPSIPTLVSGYGAAELATVAWYPSRYNATDALRGSYPVYISFAVKNIFKEFSHH